MATTPGIQTPKKRTPGIQTPKKRRAVAKPVVTHADSITQTQAQLNAHERECAARYDSVLDKLGALDKRIFRMEALHMASILGVIGLLIATLLR
jgi:hypothetical protein